jgi:hypothetical protein
MDDPSTYKKKVITVQMGVGRKMEAKIGKVVKQRCNLSPSLFSMYLEEAIKEAEEIELKGI